MSWLHVRSCHVIATVVHDSRKQKSYVILFIDEILPGKYKYFAVCQMTEV